jgi:hypothetical protein
MPIYEYGCRGCGRECKRLDKKLSVFAVTSGSESGSKAELPGPCGSCGHPDGPGSCGFD